MSFRSGRNHVAQTVSLYDGRGPRQVAEGIVCSGPQGVANLRKERTMTPHIRMLGKHFPTVAAVLGVLAALGPVGTADAQDSGAPHTNRLINTTLFVQDL